MSGSIRAKMGNDNDALNRERKSGWLKAASHGYTAVKDYVRLARTRSREVFDIVCRAEGQEGRLRPFRSGAPNVAARRKRL